MKKDPTHYIIGIDEAGRGPLAGPVSVGIFMIRKKDAVKVKKVFKGVKESKQLSAEKRDEWFTIIKKVSTQGFCQYRVVLSSAQQIDSKGISVCIRQSIASALRDMVSDEDFSRTKVLLDGGLKAPAHFLDQKTIIKGDEKQVLIALASICAKVTRDQKMIGFAKIHKGYGFEIHKGYGTVGHIKAIKKHGLSLLHRRSFTRRYWEDSGRPHKAAVAKKT